MKKLIPFISLVFLCGITMYSCKKDGSSSTSVDSHVKLLTTGKWKLKNIEFQNYDGTWTADPDFQYVNLYTIEFDTDNTFLEIPTSGASNTGTWKFSADYSLLSLINITNGNTLAAGVTVLTSSSLVLSPTSNFPSSYQGERDTYVRP